MSIKTAQQYMERTKKLSPKVFLDGKRITDVTGSPTLKSVIDATARSFEVAADPKNVDVLTAVSSITGAKINRALHINRSPADLSQRVEMSVLMGHELGTCHYRCGGSGLINSLAATTWEMDQKLGTNYRKRFDDYLRYLEENDLVLSVGSNSPKGVRTKRPLEQDDPDLSLRMVKKTSDGIMVRGAKFHQTGAPTAEEHLVTAGINLFPGEEDYALSFAVPNGTKGLTYICQHNPFTAERETAGDTKYIGNPRYGQRELAMVIFDDVFVPWERVFMCGEVEFTTPLRARQSAIHSMFESACKASWLDLMIGATQLCAEYSGLENAPLLQMDIAHMIKVREISYAIPVAAAHRAKESPVGSGIYFPDDMFCRVGKAYSSYGFWEAIEKSANVTGALLVDMPSERELQNPETRHYVEKYARAAGGAPERLRMFKFLQHWLCGLHGPSTWIGGGVPNSALMAAYNMTDFAEKKRLALNLANGK